MKILTVADIKSLVDFVSIDTFCSELITYLEQDFKKWESFTKMARPAIFSEYGVIELMPTSDGHLYSYKYVNGHPNNPKKNKLTVMGTGQLSMVETGEPILFAEMNVLTAFRTACTSAMAAKYLASKDSKSMALIGTGAQSEFQLIAFYSQFKLTDVYYYDIDSKAMEKFKQNITGLNLNINLHPCKSIEEAVKNVDIVSTMTAVKTKAAFLNSDMMKKGVFINAIGGDAPGKTELSAELIKMAKVVVEYIPQTLVEGEVQSLGETAIYSELWEIISGKKQGRTKEDEIIIFDSVGFAIEDFSTLRFVYDLATKHNIGQDLEFVPNIADPKNLFSALK